jgi:hypothetical protein
VIKSPRVRFRRRARARRDRRRRRIAPGSLAKAAAKPGADRASGTPMEVLGTNQVPMGTSARRPLRLPRMAPRTPRMRVVPRADSANRRRHAIDKRRETEPIDRADASADHEVNWRGPAASKGVGGTPRSGPAFSAIPRRSGAAPVRTPDPGHKRCDSKDVQRIACRVDPPLQR